jgi:hypothetical protein
LIIKLNEEFDYGNEFFEDLSCYQFSYFVTTILARLVLQGHERYGLQALKRLIQLDSDKRVRSSLFKHEHIHSTRQKQQFENVTKEEAK